MAAARALVRMGANGLRAKPSKGVARIFDAAGVKYMSTFKFGTGSKYPDDHTFAGRTDADVLAALDRWAGTLMGGLKESGFTAFAQFSLKDELSWSYPSLFSESGPNNISGNPRVFRRFQQYLRNQTGFTRPEQFGVRGWAELLPITRRNLTALLGEPAARADPALAAGHRARFYWTARFGSWDVQWFMAAVTAALVKANGGVSFPVYVNWPNWHGRGYMAPYSRRPGIRASAAAAARSQLLKVALAGGHRALLTRLAAAEPPGAGPSARGSMDWFESGRMRAGSMLFTEVIIIFGCDFSGLRSSWSPWY